MNIQHFRKGCQIDISIRNMVGEENKTVRVGVKEKGVWGEESKVGGDQH